MKALSFRHTIHLLQHPSHNRSHRHHRHLKVTADGRAVLASAPVSEGRDGDLRKRRDVYRSELLRLRLLRRAR